MGLFRSFIGIMLILLSIPFLSAGFGPAPSYVGFASKTYDIAAGVGLFVLGFVIGKYWVINYHKHKK
jgi:hypothetical protein